MRHGHESGEVTLGGRRVGVSRPRVRSADGREEIRLATYEHFADRDPLSRAVMERMLAGVSTRRYARTGEPVGTEVETQARSTSKSSVSRAFVERTQVALQEMMARRLDDVRLAVIMLDGIDLKARTSVVALGITTEGVKVPPWAVGRLDRERDRRDRTLERPGRTRTSTPNKASSSSLVAPKRFAKRSATCSGNAQPSSAVSATKNATSSTTCLSTTGSLLSVGFGRPGPTLTTNERSTSYERSSQSSSAPTPAPPARYVRGYQKRSPSSRLGISGNLKRTLESTNPIESMTEICRRTSRNVKRWQPGDMCLRWTAAGMLEAQQQFRRHHRLPRPRQPRRRNRAPARSTDRPDPEQGSPLSPSPTSPITPGTAATKFHGHRDILRSGPVGRRGHHPQAR